MIGFNYPKGSEWRKWDLHVHTPASKGYSGGYEEVIEQINNSDCAVVGINDYATVDGYKELIRIGGLNKYLLPIVELRMNNVLNNRHNPPLTGPRINFHIIFNPEIDINKIETFVKSITFKDARGNENRIGNISSDDKDELLKVSVNFDDIVKSLENDTYLKNNYLIWLPYDEYGGIDEIEPTNSLKQSLINRSHLIGSSNEKQIKFFLWDHERFTETQFKAWFTCRKPCIKGSDSHASNYPIGKLQDENGTPIEKYCWIKADPTFFGLQQVVYEPKDRVSIQSTKPEDKKIYNVIDKVRFVDSSGRWFSEDYIEINQNLTTIIGGKSTGKSLLLYCMAKAIDPDELVKRFGKEEKHKKEKYDFEKDILDFNFEVVWNDGTTSTWSSSVVGDTFNSGNKRILYIPQKYLNQMSEEDVDTKELLNKFVIDILCQDENINIEYKMKMESIDAAVRKAPQEISNYLNLKREVEQLDSQIKQIPSKEEIATYINNLKENIEKIKKTSKLTDEEKSEYQAVSNTVASIKKEISIIVQDLETLNSFYQNSSSIINSLEGEKSSCEMYLDDKDIKAVFLKNFNYFQSFKDKMESSYKIVIQAGEEKLVKLNTELRKHEEQESQYIQKSKLEKELKSEIEDLSKKLNDELQTLNTLEQLEKNLKIKKDTISTKLGGLINSVEEIYKIYNELKTYFVDVEKKLDNIKLDIKVGFKEQEFNEDFIEGYLNRPDLKKIIELDDFSYKYDEKLHIQNIKKILDGLLNEKIKLLKGNELTNAIYKLFENKYTLDFHISYEGDSFDKMSPGKKGLVLLYLLINLSDKLYPVLLDQPEDDLDNRSVYNKLVAFLKNKKKSRQIIIVTHNPNLVVGADAEEVIVANQGEQEQGRENLLYKFEYVSGSLENSFSDSTATGVLYQKGIREHVCEILEGGEEAFQKREQKYSFLKV